MNLTSFGTISSVMISTTTSDNDINRTKLHCFLSALVLESKDDLIFEQKKNLSLLFSLIEKYRLKDTERPAHFILN